MGKTISIIIFILIALSIYFFLHWFIYFSISKGLALSSETRKYFILALILLGSTFIAGEILSRTMPAFIISYIGAIWLGILSISFTVLIFQNIATLILPRYSKNITIFAIFLIIITTIYAIINASGKPVLKEIVVKIKKMPKNLSGFTIVQLSDIHLGIITPKNYLASIMQITDSLKADIIVITGDLLDEDISKYERFCDALQKLHSKYGVFAVTGNHEYYAGLDKFLNIAKKCNITVLQNEMITIAGDIQLVGINDAEGKFFSGGGADLFKAIEKLDRSKPAILLNHRPTLFRKAVEMGIDLQLSGHIHAGQISPLKEIFMLVYRYPYGFYHYKSSYIYTTSGTGTWGPPMRTFSKSEIVKITLESGEA